MDYSQKAMDLFFEGYNCAQAVVLAFADEINVDRTELAKLSAPLGGGIARLREVCGAVSGMAMVIGALKDKGVPPTHEEKAALYAFTRELISEFESKFGSHICREILGINGPEKPEPLVRDRAYFESRPCMKCIGYAAQLIADRVLEK